MTSNKPYLIGAFYDWISDNELTPYIVVDVNVYGVLVPMSYVNDGQITLNISSSALGDIAMGETAIEFSARFGGKLEHITVPYGSVAAIYAKENGAGTSFPIEHPVIEEEKHEPDSTAAEKRAQLKTVTSSQSSTDNSTKSKDKAKSKPSLKVIK